MNDSTNITSEIFPKEVEAGEKISIQCSFSGHLNFGFFDVALELDNKGEFIVWMPDSETWNVYRDTGVLRGTKQFSTEWKPFIPDWIPNGEYKIWVLLYDDKDGKKLGRIPLAKQEHKIIIRDSIHPEAIFVRKLYRLLLKRMPEITGYRTWFENLQIHLVNRIQVLEIGFLRSPEFRVRFINKLVKKQNIEKEQLEKSIQNLMHHSLSDYISNSYPELVSMIDLKKRVIAFLNLDEKGVEELTRIEKSAKNIHESLELIINNFLLEKYILINCLFPNVPKEERRQKIGVYLTNPEEIIKEILV
jgi:hypothetical protein